VIDKKGGGDPSGSSAIMRRVWIIFREEEKGGVLTYSVCGH